MVGVKLLPSSTTGVPDARQATFVLTGVTLPIANGIKRALDADVATVSFGSAADSGLAIVENTGALHDPMIKDRLGLIPIHFDAAEIDAFRREAYVFELHAKFPTSAQSSAPAGGLMEVTSRDFRVADEDGKDLGVKLAQRLFPTDPVTGDGILITQLRRGESLHVKGHAAKASGRTHACFCPVSRLALVYDVDDKDEPTTFRLTLRSECAMTPKELVFRALQSLRERVAGVATAVSNGDLPLMEVVYESGVKLHEIVFAKGQDSTLGEILQVHLLKVAPAFAGYDIPHNLDERMVFRFDAGGKGSGSSSSQALSVFARATKGAIDEISAVMVAL